jgi:hypothetical protein
MTRARTSEVGMNLALGAGYLGAGAGGGIICPPSDNSFTCQLKRLVAGIQGIVFLLLSLFVVYYAYTNRKSLFSGK